MSSKKVLGLVQPNFQQGPKEFNAYYLPYSIGSLWAYAKQFDIINDNYELKHFLWRRDSIDQTAKYISNSHVLGFSTYVWNKNYNYALAKRVKELNPGCTIVFGGPEVPISKSDIFTQFPFIDVVVKGEGEIIFKNLLEAIVNETSWMHIKGLLVNVRNEIVNTGFQPRIDLLDDLPSPYLTGVFDKMMREVDGYEWNVTIETNRGCPYQCTFCDWGSATYSKIKKFNLEKVFAELEWLGKNRCGFATITDANFGIFVDRDNAIADKLLEVQDKYGCPNSFSMSWAKDQKKEVFDIVFKLIKNPKFNQGLTVSVQSMDLGVLENIKRKNLDQHKIKDVFALCDKNNVPVYTEIILGLPGETKQSWKEGFYKIFEAGNHTGINILHAQLLENTEMNLLQQTMYKMKSIPVYDYMSGSYNDNELQESVNAVISTKDLTYEDMLDCHIHSWFMQTFHINGLTTYISRTLNKLDPTITYSKFYDALYEFLNKDEWFIAEQDTVRQYYNNWMSTGRISHPNIANIEIHGWNIVHRTTLMIHLERRYEHIFSLIHSFITDTFSDIDENLLQELLEFQQNYVVDYSNIKNYPHIQQFNYDFLGYLLDNLPITNPTIYKFDFLENKDISLDRFLENIYFARKRNFGKTLISK